MLTDWQQELATGNADIDEQHKELFRKINGLAISCRDDGRGEDELSKLFLFLRLYVRTHFANEERLQVRHGFPGYQTHKEQHDAFCRQLHDLEEEFARQGATPAFILKAGNAMHDWLVNHINRLDKEMAAFVRDAEHGAASFRHGS